MEVGSMGGRLFTDKLVFGGCKFTAFGRLTVPPQLLLLTLPTLVACRAVLFGEQEKIEVDGSW